MSQKISVCLIDMLATGFYSGRLPIAPGTWGSALAACLIAVLYYFFPEFGGFTWGIALAAVLTLVGILVSNKALALKLYGESKDPGCIVIDEFAGYAVACAGLGTSWIVLLLSFFLFRIFDVLKPPPVRQLEALPNGVGIVVDDVAAGIYANIVGWLILLNI